MSDEPVFAGAKIALILDDRLVAYRRDHKPGIPFPGLWDLPGGGREGDETPIQCALREAEEEFGLRLSPDVVTYVRRYVRDDGQISYFLAARISAEEVAAIVFGDEGETWRMMPITEFLFREDAAPRLQVRLADYLEVNRD